MRPQFEEFGWHRSAMTLARAAEVRGRAQADKAKHEAPRRRRKKEKKPRAGN
jgi:hypothetical protein